MVGKSLAMGLSNAHSQPETIDIPFTSFSRYYAMHVDRSFTISPASSANMAQPRRPIIIANVSGATGDGPLALHQVVRNGPVDVATADYLAEVNVGAWLVPSAFLFLNFRS